MPRFDQTALEIRGILALVVASSAVYSVLVGSCYATEDAKGAEIYAHKCASCHGANGEGTAEHYPKPLAGDRSAKALSKFIAKTMPEDNPGDCVGEEADSVAEFVYDRFYSKIAQARNKPPRIEFARLTVRQYKNAVSDLIGSFREVLPIGETRGLKGEYSSGGGGGGGRNRRRTRKNINRVDATVNFQFGVVNPVVGPLDPKLTKVLVKTPVSFVPVERMIIAATRNYSVRWQGSILAADSGEYEFVVKTENAMRLWVNDSKTPLIDAGVKSGKDSEYRGKVHLLGGRWHFLRLDLNKTTEPTGSIVLEWKTPRGTQEVVPERNLATERSPELFVLSTAFPPDDKSMGYERGNLITKAWDQAATDAAIESANYVWLHINELASTGEGKSDREAKLREFCRAFAERAFRRPLSDEMRRLVVDKQFEQAPSQETAVKRVVLLTLKSPRFLYHDASRLSDGWSVAEQMAWTLWDSLPDKQLLESAGSGNLRDPGRIRSQAERMIADPQARSKLRDFFRSWLKVDRAGEINKDRSVFPEFDEATACDLETSLDLFVEDVVWSVNSDFRRLLNSPDLFLNGRLARFYAPELTLAIDAPFRKAALPNNQRSGVLTHPYLLSTLAYTRTSSPIHRGVFIARGLLGRVLPPPPEAVAPLAPELHPRMSTRERIALQTKPASCQTCHGMINPLGFTLEQYDAVGRYRTKESDSPIDPRGAYVTHSGDSVEFSGVHDLADFLASSEESHAAFVQQFFHYLVKQPIRAYGSQTGDDLRKSLEDNGFNIQSLTVDVVVRSALGPLKQPSGQPPKIEVDPHAESSKKKANWYDSISGWFF